MPPIEIAYPPDSCLAQRVRRHLAPHPVMTVDDDIGVAVDRAGDAVERAERNQPRRLDPRIAPLVRLAYVDERYCMFAL